MADRSECCSPYERAMWRLYVHLEGSNKDDSDDLGIFGRIRRDETFLLAGETHHRRVRRLLLYKSGSIKLDNHYIRVMHAELERVSPSIFLGRR